MNKNEFKNFFEPYSKNVDNAQDLAFWKLSDELVREIIKRNIPNNPKSILMDAGGGTGRWICKLSKDFDGKFMFYDLSEDMIAQAKINIEKAGIKDRVTMLQGDLCDMGAVKSNSIDNIVSIYSPISFIDEKDQAVKELYRVLKKGGKLIIMGHGFCNALHSKINNYLAPAKELKIMDDSEVVKWGEHVPELNIFSKESMESLLTGAGFKIDKTYGVPVFVQPGPEDFDPENKLISRISSALNDKAFFKGVFELEMKHNAEPSVVNRGMNIFSVGIKEEGL